MGKYTDGKQSKIHHQSWCQEISLFSSVNERFLVPEKLLVILRLVLAALPHPWGSIPIALLLLSLLPTCVESTAAEGRH